MTTRLLLMALTAGLLAAPVRADDPKPDPNAELRGEALALLPQAFELAALGREVKSAETLVVAGGMVLRANSLFGGKTEDLTESATDDKGKAITAPAAKPVPLVKQADGLFDEARTMAATSTDKGKLSAVEAMIKAVQAEFPKRGSVGGPRTATRVLQPGETHTYTMTFYAGQPAAVAMTSTGPARIQFDLVHKGGNTLFTLKGLNAQYQWVPVRDRDGVKHFTVTLRNMGRQPTTYTFAKN